MRDDFVNMRLKFDAARKRFMSEGKPYIAYVTGGKRYGCWRIGKWSESWETKDPLIGKEETHHARFNVQPKHIIRLLRTMRNDLWITEIHGWVEPLTEDEQAEWKRELEPYDVIWDAEMVAG